MVSSSQHRVPTSGTSAWKLVQLVDVFTFHAVFLFVQSIWWKREFRACHRTSISYALKTYLYGHAEEA